MTLILIFLINWGLIKIMRRFITYLILFTVIVCASCSDEIIEAEGRSEDGPFCGTLSLNVSAGSSEVGTRSLNFNDGATVTLNSLWVGIYDIESGKRIGRTRIDNFDKSVLSGTASRNIVTVDFYSERTNPEVLVVGVSNYEGVVTWDRTPAIEAVEAADTWSQLVEIDIDAQSAYAGSKGEDPSSQAPFLMGYYLESEGLSRVPKFDQIDHYGEASVAIYPERAANAASVRLVTDESGVLYIPSGALTLRRMVSNINVNIESSDNIKISDVRFKAFNNPQVVYLVQRRTDTKNRSHVDWQVMSPNRADMFLSSDGSYTGNPTYKDYTEWKTANANGGMGFSFQHFENKHWGFGDLKSFSDREAKNDDGTFKALSPSSSAPYNDHASYFKIKMHATDTKTGRSGEIEYTVHEGLCNTDDGRATEDQSVRMKDYGSFRNTNYTYTVTVNGFENIIVNASLDEDSEEHNNGQSGIIWDLRYANGESYQIPEEGGAYGEMKFGRDANIAFRLYWNSVDGQKVDICYNYPDNTAGMFGGFWPDSDSNTVFADNINVLNSLPANLANAVKITDGVSEYTVTEFLSNMNPAKTYRFKFDAYEGAWDEDQRESMRALYVFDRNELNVDYDRCSSYGRIYIAEQYPRDIRPTVGFNTSNTVWHSAIHSTSENKWCGCVNSKIDLVWKHDNAFEGYYIEIDGRREKISRQDLPSYLSTLNGSTVVTYPYITDRVTDKTYDVTITPIPADKSFKGKATVVAGALAVYPTQWLMNSTPLWKDLNINGKTYADVEYRGLELFHNHSTANTSVKGNYISFGGAGNTTTRVIRFYTVKSGKITVSMCSNASGTSTGIDNSRYLQVDQVKYDEKGNQVIIKRQNLQSQGLPFAGYPANRVIDISIEEPCWIYVYGVGSNTRTHGITFEAY